jgi:hypothetical protein
MSLQTRLNTMFKRDGSRSRAQRTDLQAFVAAVFGGTIESLYPTQEDVVATTGGATTGLISAASTLVNATTDSINKQISLPAAVAGKKMQIVVAATGCELISAVAADKVNGVVVGATNEAALVALTVYSLEYDGTDNWVMTGLTALGAVETAVVPDTL